MMNIIILVILFQELIFKLVLSTELKLYCVLPISYIVYYNVSVVYAYTSIGRYD